MSFQRICFWWILYAVLCVPVTTVLILELLPLAAAPVERVLQARYEKRFSEEYERFDEDLPLEAKVKQVARRVGPRPALTTLGVEQAFMICLAASVALSLALTSPWALYQFRRSRTSPPCSRRPPLVP